jgi:hypothetical protein
MTGHQLAGLKRRYRCCRLIDGQHDDCCIASVPVDDGFRWMTIIGNSAEYTVTSLPLTPELERKLIDAVNGVLVEAGVRVTRFRHPPPGYFDRDLD